MLRRGYVYDHPPNLFGITQGALAFTIQTGCAPDATTHHGILAETGITLERVMAWDVERDLASTHAHRPQGGELGDWVCMNHGGQYASAARDLGIPSSILSYAVRTGYVLEEDPTRTVRTNRSCDVTGIDMSVDLDGFV